MLKVAQFEQPKQGLRSKSPSGSKCKNHVYTSFLSKINVKFGPFGSFGFVWTKDKA